MINEPTTDPDAGDAAVKRTSERWETLAQAFQAYQFPSENLPLVQRIVDSVGMLPDAPESVADLLAVADDDLADALAEADG